MYVHDLTYHDALYLTSIWTEVIHINERGEKEGGRKNMVANGQGHWSLKSILFAILNSWNAYNVNSSQHIG